jgi:hypothetical protein
MGDWDLFFEINGGGVAHPRVNGGLVRKVL